jgi:hypothetical protein
VWGAELCSPGKGRCPGTVPHICAMPGGGGIFQGPRDEFFDVKLSLVDTSLTQTVLKP